MSRVCRRVVESGWFDPLMLGVIGLNAIVLGAETYESFERDHGATLDVLNEVFLGIFVVELVIRFAASSFRPKEFFSSGWHVFDFLVVAASFAPGLRENATLLRVLRLLRIVRAIRLLPDLRVLIVAIGRSVPGVLSLAAMTLLLIYVYGMVGWVIFHDHDPANFSSIGTSMITMFVLLTLENLPTYIDKGQELSDWTILFFVSYVLLASFLVFNLFIGIVINSMDEARAIEQRKAEVEAGESFDLDDRIQAVRKAMQDLEHELAARGTRGRSPR